MTDKILATIFFYFQRIVWDAQAFLSEAVTHLNFEEPKLLRLYCSMDVSSMSSKRSFVSFYTVKITGMTIGRLAVFCKRNLLTSSVMLSLT